jgi:hypothetical protein
MRFEGLIDMHNNNSMVALAFVRDSKKPYEMFCNFITYSLLTQKNKQLTYENLKSKVTENFGLNLPFHLYEICIRLLKNDAIIEVEHGKIRLIKLNFDIEIFEKSRRKLMAQEKQLLINLIEYVHHDFDILWSDAIAREYLNEFLLADDNASTIFMNDDLSCQEATYTKMSAIWIVQQFVKKMIGLKDDNYEYLLDIIKGLMIYVGVYHSNDAATKTSLDDTDFYLDTKLILRFLGYSSQLYVEAAFELVKMIREKYKGNICVFEHTIGEVSSAIYNAYTQLKSDYNIEDNELMLYYHNNKSELDLEDLRIYSESVEYELLEHGFRVQKPIDWSDTTLWSDNIDIIQLETHLKKMRSSWKPKAIENDVYSMNQINMLRNSDYSEYFGGEKKLPVFITTNSSLINCIKAFANKKAEENATWNRNILPIISDNSIMCKLWLQNDYEHDNQLPELTLALNAYAILPYDYEFFNRLKANSVALKSKYNCKIFNLDKERQIKLEAALIKSTNGDLSNINEDDLILTINEIHKVEKDELSKERDYFKELDSDKKREIEGKDAKINELQRETIKAYALLYINKLGINRLLVIIAYSWQYIVAIIVVALTILVNILTKKNVNNLPSAVAIVIAVLIALGPFLVKMLDKALSQKVIENLIKTKCINRAKVNYKKMLEKKITGDQKNYKDQIIDYCIANTKCLKNI